MDTSILNGELASTITDALFEARIPFDIVVTHNEPGEGGTPYNPPPSVPVDHPCQGFVDNFTASDLLGTLIEIGDVKVIIIASTLDITPSPGDRVTARGKTYTIMNVAADTALATYELLARA